MLLEGCESLAVTKCLEKGCDWDVMKVGCVATPNPCEMHSRTQIRCENVGCLWKDAEGNMAVAVMTMQRKTLWPKQQPQS